MIILMPYEEPLLCAKTFDAELLRKETRASIIFLKALIGEAPGWDRHSTCKMWEGHSDALAVYGLYMAYELQARQVGGLEEAQIIMQIAPGANDWLPEMPPWVGSQDIHVSHRAFLLAMNPEYYGAKFPGVRPSVELAWPEVQWAE